MRIASLSRPLAAAAFFVVSASAAGLVGCGSDEEATPAEAPALCGTSGAIASHTWPTSVVHVPLDTEVDYTSVPPSIGDHYGQWAAWGEYPDAMDPRYWVHNLEHGGTVLLTSCEDCDDLVDSLRSYATSIADDDGGPFRWVMTPYAGNLGSRFAIVTWGWTYKADDFVQEDVECFVKAHYRRAPEDVASAGAHNPEPGDGTGDMGGAADTTSDGAGDGAQTTTGGDDATDSEGTTGGDTGAADAGGGTGGDPGGSGADDGGGSGADGSDQDKVLVGYYPGWAVYSRHYYPHNMASVEDPGVASKTVPGPYYSHLTYAFVNVSASGECTAHDPGAELPGGWKTFGPSTGIFEDLKALKAANPKLKVLMSVGGWTFSQNFSDVARDEAARDQFASSCVAFMTEHGFDGIDIDWEYPTETGKDGSLCAVGKDPCSMSDKQAATNMAGDGTTYYDLDATACVTCRPEDTANYVHLLQALRDELDAQHPADHKPLTVAVGGAPKHVAQLDVPGMAGVLDWIMVMSYDFHGSWDAQTGFNAALASDDGTGWDVTSSIDSYIAAGAPANQLVMGLPFYGRGWSGVASPTPGAPGSAPAGSLNSISGDVLSGGTIMGSWEAGIWNWRLVAEKYLDGTLETGINGYTRYWDAVGQVPYLFSETEGVWVSYDDPKSLAAKAAFAVEKGLRGAMVWDVTADDCNDTLAVAVNAALGRQVVGAPAPGCGGAGGGTNGGSSGGADGGSSGGTCDDPETGECWAIGPWCGDDGMTVWCNQNCPGNCPPDICACPE
ncbi:MAG: GH18 family chitinase [Myxococcota bacterium]|jgi:GH18 family chitinase